MRVIKFRVWEVKEKRMVYPDDRNGWNQSLYAVLADGSLMETIYESCNNPSDEYVVMQYTGIKDKSGKEMYEGDIVKVRDSSWMMRDEFETYQVKWGGDYPAFDLYSVDGKYHTNDFNQLGCACNEFEVIGNIYETPEMLKNGQEETN